jgi:hypothetical protein
MVYTLGEAAKACGKSKATLSKAIKSGKISAKKNDNGSFSIDPSELHRVYPPTLSTVEGKQYETPVETPRLTPEKDLELIELRVKLDAANQRINDLETDKDAWREQAQKLALAPPQSSKGFLSRLFGK